MINRLMKIIAIKCSSCDHWWISQCFCNV